MDKHSFQRIKNLIDNSGLLNSEVSKQKTPIAYPYAHERILISGAAGSIGSGLTRLLLNSKFDTLILLDNAETPLFYLKREIDDTKHIKAVLGDIRDTDKMSQIFKTYKPTIVFHTAAYKHVSLVEDNAFEALKTNIFATQSLAQLALKHSTKRFIFISTDKAVNPIGIMGMTKLISERYLSKLNSNSSVTKFISARFGNVFGSNGSVVPLFIEQLKNGEHLTITHKDATRLFIEKNRACHLILELIKLDFEKHSKVSFNMGQPIKIKDLAEALKEILKKEGDINVSGLSKGEKLHETLIANDEKLVATKLEDIFYIEQNTKSNTVQNLDQLNNLNHKASYAEIKEMLEEICDAF